MRNLLNFMNPASQDQKEKSSAKMADLAPVLKEQLRNLLRREQKSTDGSTFFKAVEATQTLLELDKTIKPFENSQEFLTQENLAIFIPFFKTRWQRIEGTDLAYNITPTDPINQMLLELAKVIASYHPRSSDSPIDPNQLLMPGFQGEEESSPSTGEKGRKKLADYIMANVMTYLNSLTYIIISFDHLLVIAEYPQHIARIVDKLIPRNLHNGISISKLITLLNKIAKEDWRAIIAKLDLNEVFKKLGGQDLAQAANLLGIEKFKDFLALVPVTIFNNITIVDLQKFYQSLNPDLNKVEAAKILFGRLGANNLRVMLKNQSALHHVLNKTFEEKERAEQSVSHSICCELLKVLLDDKQTVIAPDHTIIAKEVEARFKIMPQPLYLDFLNFLLEAKLGVNKVLYFRSLISSTENLQMVLTSSLLNAEKAGLLNIIEVPELVHYTTLEQLTSVLQLISVDKYPSILKKFTGIDSTKLKDILLKLPVEKRSAFLDCFPAFKKFLLDNLKNLIPLIGTKDEPQQTELRVYEVQACLADSKKLNIFLTSMENRDELIFANLIGVVSIQHIQRIINSVQDLIALLKLFNLEQRQAVLNQFSDAHIAHLLNTSRQDVAELINLFPISQRYAIWQKIPQEQTKKQAVSQLYSSIDEYSQLLATVPAAQKDIFLTYLPTADLLRQIPISMPERKTVDHKELSTISSSLDTKSLDHKRSASFSADQQDSKQLPWLNLVNDLVMENKAFDIVIAKIESELKSSTEKDQAAILFCQQLGSAKLHAILNQEDRLAKVLSLMTQESMQKLVETVGRGRLAAVVLFHAESLQRFFASVPPENISFLYNLLDLNRTDINRVIALEAEVPPQNRLAYLYSLPREFLAVHYSNLKKLADSLNLLTPTDQSAFLQSLADNVLRSSFYQIVPQASTAKNDLQLLVTFLDGEIKRNVNHDSLVNLVDVLRKQQLLQPVIIRYGLDATMRIIGEKYQRTQPSLYRVLSLTVVNAYHLKRNSQGEYSGWSMGSRKGDKLRAADNLGLFMESAFKKPMVKDRKADAKAGERKEIKAEEKLDSKEVKVTPLDASNNQQLNSGQLGRIFKNFQHSADLTEQEFRRRVGEANTPAQLLAVIQDYRIYRSTRLEDYFHFYSRICGGYSRSEKLAALDLMEQCVKGEITSPQLRTQLEQTPRIYGAAREGKLSLIYQEITSREMLYNSEALRY